MPRGGVRAGAGRPKGALNLNHEERRQRQYRATENEHELVKRFLRIIRADAPAAEKIITEYEKIK